MAIVDSILMEIEQESKVTQRVLDRVPGDKLNWKPHPKSSSLGQLAMHIAVGQGRLAEILSKDTHDPNGGPQRPSGPPQRQDQIPDLERGRLPPAERLRSRAARPQHGDIGRRIPTDQGCGDLPSVGQPNVDPFLAMNHVVGRDNEPFG